LSLNIIKHDISYKLWWLNECGEVMVTKHVLINWNWKEKWSWNGSTTMWDHGYHVKICTEVVSKVYLYEIIISYDFHNVLLKARVGKKKALKA